MHKFFDTKLHFQYGATRRPSNNEDFLRSRHPEYQVLQGDCIDVLTMFEAATFDMVLTDPPYIAGYKDRSGRSVANDDNGEWLAPAFKAIFRVMKPDSLCVSFYGWTQTDRFFSAWRDAGFRIVGHISFPKRYTSTVRLMRYQHESAYLLAKGHPPTPENVIGDVIDWGTYSGNKLHPTQKPLSILLPLIQSFTRPGALVLDPFCGSGSTLAASLMCGRKAVGVELLDANAQVATQRLERIVHSTRWAPVEE
jgi:DNA modification methylase